MRRVIFVPLVGRAVSIRQSFEGIETRLAKPALFPKVPIQHDRKA